MGLQRPAPQLISLDIFFRLSCFVRFRFEPGYSTRVVFFSTVFSRAVIRTQDVRGVGDVAITGDVVRFSNCMMREIGHVQCAK